MNEISRTPFDHKPKSLLGLVIEKCKSTEFEYTDGPNLSRHYLPSLKQLLDGQPLELFNLVWDRLSADEEISAAMAHTKTAARIPTEWFNNDFLYTTPDRIYLDFLLLDVLGFTDAERMYILHARIMDYGRGMVESRIFFDEIINHKEIDS
jgi:hypothetical protein